MNRKVILYPPPRRKPAVGSRMKIWGYTGPKTARQWSAVLEQGVSELPRSWPIFLSFGCVPVIAVFWNRIAEGMPVTVSDIHRMTDFAILAAKLYAIYAATVLALWTLGRVIRQLNPKAGSN